MGGDEELTFWRAGDRHLVASKEGNRTRYYVLHLDGKVATIHQDGDFSLEDELYRWQHVVEGDELRRHTTIERWNYGRTESVEVVLKNLRPVSAEEHAHWEEAFPVIRDVHESELEQQRITMGQEEARRRASFLAALPRDATELEFRRVGKGWGVAVPGSAPFWTDDTFPWRGKDLHIKLGQWVRAELPEPTTFRTVLESESDWAWYSDD